MTPPVMAEGKLSVERIAYLGQKIKLGHRLQDWDVDRLCAMARRSLVMEEAAEKEEAAHLRTIDQRDDAEEALSDMFLAVTGRHPEWSNMFTFSDAVREVEETVAALTSAQSDADEGVG